MSIAVTASQNRPLSLRILGLTLRVKRSAKWLVRTGVSALLMHLLLWTWMPRPDWRMLWRLDWVSMLEICSIFAVITLFVPQRTITSIVRSFLRRTINLPTQVRLWMGVRMGTWVRPAPIYFSFLLLLACNRHFYFYSQSLWATLLRTSLFTQMTPGSFLQGWISGSFFAYRLHSGVDIAHLVKSVVNWISRLARRLSQASSAIVRWVMGTACRLLIFEFHFWLNEPGLLSLI
jgi:hypothetical protein